MSQSHIVTAGVLRTLAAIGESKSSRAEKYEFQDSMLQFVHFQRFYVQNRLKSKAKFWKRAKNAVPLQSIRRSLHVLRLVGDS